MEAFLNFCQTIICMIIGMIIGMIFVDLSIDFIAEIFKKNKTKDKEN